MPTISYTVLDDYIEQLQELRKLLRNPMVADIARRILAEQSIDTPQNGSGSSRQPDLPSRTPVPVKRGRKHGALVSSVLKTVMNSTSQPVTAKNVTAMLESTGFEINARDKQLAVSKALRALAAKGKIEAEQNGGKKSPFFYRPKGSAQQSIPMQ